jgi:single-strand DNA-binding protein
MKTIGMGRLGRDAEIRYTADGTPVAKLAMAYNYGKPGQDGKRPVQWIDASLWGKRAESLAPYMTKGSQHCFTLEAIHIETFQKQDGTQGTTLAATVLDVELGPRSESAAPRPAPAPAPRPAPVPQRAPSSGFDDLDDSIPF